MYEIKCDVLGCSEREPVEMGILGSGAPIGWRVINYTISIMPTRKPDPKVPLRKLAKKIGGDAGELYGEFLEAATYTEASIAIPTRPVTRHICPRHDLPKFNDGGVEEEEIAGETVA